MEDEIMKQIAMFRLKIRKTDLFPINTEIRNIKLESSKQLSLSQSLGSSRTGSLMQSIEQQRISKLQTQLSQEIDSIKLNGASLAELRLFDKNNVLSKYINDNQTKTVHSSQNQMTQKQFDDLVEKSQNTEILIQKRSKLIEQTVDEQEKRISQQQQRLERSLSSNPMIHKHQESVKKWNKQLQQTQSKFQEVMQQEQQRQLQQKQKQYNHLNTAAERRNHFNEQRSQSIGSKLLNSSKKVIDSHKMILDNQQDWQQMKSEEILQHLDNVEQKVQRYYDQQKQNYGTVDVKISKAAAEKERRFNELQIQKSQIMQNREKQREMFHEIAQKQKYEQQMRQIEKLKQKRLWQDTVIQKQKQIEYQNAQNQSKHNQFSRDSAKQFAKMREDVSAEFRAKSAMRLQQAQQMQLIVQQEKLKRQKVITQKQLKDLEIEARRLELQQKYDRTNQLVSKIEQEKLEAVFFYSLLSPVQKLSERRGLVQKRCQSANQCTMLKQQSIPNIQQIQQSQTINQ